MRFHEVRGETNIERNRRKDQKTYAQKSVDSMFAKLPKKIDKHPSKEKSEISNEKFERIKKLSEQIEKGDLKKEAVSTKLRLYESCDNGIITKEERDSYLEMLESFMSEYVPVKTKDTIQKQHDSFNNFSSQILDPNKIFKDPKNSYVDMRDYHDIENDNNLQKFILSLSKKAMTLIDKEIDKMYDNWYDDEDNNFTKAQVKLMARNLFDVISMKKSSKEGMYWVEIWVNSNVRHKDSDNFFGCHCMTVTYEIDPKTRKVVKTYDVDFGG